MEDNLGRYFFTAFFHCTCIRWETFMDRATATLCLYNMGALYNIKSVLCDVKIVLCDMRSALCDMRTSLRDNVLIWYEDWTLWFGEYVMWHECTMWRRCAMIISLGNICTLWLIPQNQRFFISITHMLRTIITKKTIHSVK